MKVAIAGYGVEGRTSHEYYKNRGDEVTVVDERDAVELPDGIAAILGPGSFDKLDDFDLIIRSPGIAPKKLPYGDKVWSATREFFEKRPAPIIGVTGTGFGTMCMTICAMSNC